MNDKLSVRVSPSWLSRSVMYQITLRAFTPEGTLRAAAAKLPEVAALGVDIVYLCPICLQDDDPRREFWSDRQRASGTNNPCNPYRIKDYDRIDPEYGTPDDLREFVQTAHRLKLRVMLDIVFFHCGPTAVFLKDHPDYVRCNPDGSIRYGSWHFPELNYDNPALREYLWRNLEYWMREFAVDGYRCDVGSSIPLDFWESARVRLEKINPEVIMLSEGFLPENQRLAFDLDYDFFWTFSLHAVFNRGKTALQVRQQAWEEQHQKVPRGTRFMRFSDSHDIAHDTSFGMQRKPGQSEQDWQNIVGSYGIPDVGLPPGSRIENSWGQAANDAVLVLNFTLDGIPLLYNGQEIADAATHSIYDRFPVDWSKAATPAGQARRTLCRRLCELRHREAALTSGTVTWLDSAEPDAVLAFQRVAGPETVLVLVNLTSHPVRPAVATGDDAPLLGTAADELPAYGYFVGKKQE